MKVEFRWIALAVAVASVAVLSFVFWPREQDQWVAKDDYHVMNTRNGDVVNTRTGRVDKLPTAFQHDSDSTPWGWIIAGTVVLAAIAWRSGLLGRLAREIDSFDLSEDGSSSSAEQESTQKPTTDHSHQSDAQ